MRLLAFSDLHRNKDAARAIVAASGDADVMIGAGDFATHGAGLTDTLDILAAFPRPCILVAGNHDDLPELRRASAPYENFHVLHGQAFTFAGVHFFGLGFEIASTPGALPQSCIQETQAEILLKPCPPDAVLITHQPPLGIADIQRDGSHQGSSAIRAVIQRTQPQLNLCGHIHHAWGLSGRDGRCAIHNLGPTANWFDI